MKRLACLLLFALLCAGCRRNETIHVITGEAMGTSYRIKIVGVLKEDPKFDTLLARLDADLSTWREDSWVSRFNRAKAGESMEMPESVAELIRMSRDIHRQTKGCFDPAIGALIRLWGFGAWERTWQGDPTPQQVDAARQAGSMRNLTIHGSRLAKVHDGLMLDFSGIAKGYAVDLMARRLHELGHQDFLIEFGGDLIAQGKAPGKEGWLVDGPALNEPMLLQNQAVATSGSEHHFRNGLCHIIDPQNGRPVATGPPSSAIATTCAEADALATARHVEKARNNRP